MRRFSLPVLAILFGSALPSLAGPEAQPLLVVATDKGALTCLSDAELRDEIAAKRAIPQATALKAARAAVTAEPVRARLCQRDGVLVYVITALAKDGKVTRLTLDAATGRVVGQR
jgi:uncharacterized membrane protein YkoI